jgi:hypothetical protein
MNSNITASYSIQENNRLIFFEKRMRMRKLIDNIKQNNLTQQKTIIDQPQLNIK